MVLITNTGVGVVVEAQYDPREDPNSIFGEDASWECKSDSTRNELAPFLGSKKGDTLDKQKKLLF